MKEAPEVHVVSCSSTVAISHKWHHVNLSIKYSYSISKLLSFASDSLLGRLFRKLRLLAVGNITFCLNLLSDAAYPFAFMTTLFLDCITICLFHFLIFVGISHHSSQPCFTGLSKPSFSGPLGSRAFSSSVCPCTQFSPSYSSQEQIWPELWMTCQGTICTLAWAFFWLLAYITGFIIFLFTAWTMAALEKPCV